ncbi:GDSL family lipase [Sporolactobacillus laevolacticus DSM 442]|uniref:GDSL family lipase n=1 Tax=Sporolactobacillus laevolacticus DSM 442 TaxID=1395513 RepID=V6IXT2_9BACL|nr:GDSL family lipase [Sporolactobacillus laevolacticus DSM 442]
MPHKKPEKVSYNIVALGDSLTEGVGDLDNQGYVGVTTKILKKETLVKKVSIQDFGHRGDTSTDLLKKLKRPEIIQAVKKSNTIFLTIGGNDLVHVFKKHFLDLHASDFSTQQKIFSVNLNQVFAEVRRLNPNAHIYYFGLYNPFEDYLGKANKDFVPILNRWNANSTTITKKYTAISFIPTSDLFKGKTDQLLYKDHFHPNKQGYAKMSGRLLDYLKKSRSSVQR